ncbi:eukaryotic aspartyl protease family protein [Actinidia rufa]|uniref:Eukaryotic aspartyl protease family protein n=1 Tax=Actinidia rufa TaxID=165716 RepID=A0A7J0F2I3_9ERIC|nr:eukaryotic aspartyl protease family protein [Actinidia rufa]
MTFYSHSFFKFILFTIFLSTFSSIEADDDGFSVDLIHCDSWKSPLYNPSLTPWECMNNALQRSNDRVIRLMSRPLSPGAASTEIIGTDGAYFMSMAIGTLPVQLLGMADTGSDLTWIQCEPCKKCYKQKGPRFNPKRSSTYKNFPCNSKICRSIEETSKPSCFLGIKKKCQYTSKYQDNSSSRGVIATETITLGSTAGQPLRLRDIVFGCAHNTIGKFSEAGSGIIGLGGGQPSLISLLDSLIGGRFSYCLVPPFSLPSSSKMYFGGNAVVSGRGVVSTPLVVRSNVYYVKLKALSVGKKKLELNISSKSDIILDMGSTATYIPPELYFPRTTV